MWHHSNASERNCRSHEMEEESGIQDTFLWGAFVKWWQIFFPLGFTLCKMFKIANGRYTASFRKGDTVSEQAESPLWAHTYRTVAVSVEGKITTWCPTMLETGVGSFLAIVRCGWVPGWVRSPVCAGGWKVTCHLKTYTQANTIEKYPQKSQICLKPTTWFCWEGVRMQAPWAEESGLLLPFVAFMAFLQVQDRVFSV